jgi:hypothetical protein
MHKTEVKTDESKSSSSIPENMRLPDGEIDEDLPDNVDWELVKKKCGPRPRDVTDQCCGEGCVTCVIDVYDRKLEKWRILREEALDEQRYE